jgi:hypothetical protein
METQTLTCAEMDSGVAVGVAHGSPASTFAVERRSDQLSSAPRYIDDEAAAGA